MSYFHKVIDFCGLPFAAHFGEGRIGMMCGALAAPLGGYVGYKGGKKIAEFFLKKIYGQQIDLDKQSLKERIITKGIGGGIGAITGSLLTFSQVTTKVVLFQLSGRGRF